MADKTLEDCELTTEQATSLDKALAGPPVKCKTRDLPSRIVEVYKNNAAIERAGVANTILAGLRHLRDNYPKEWDALNLADKDGVLVSTWYYLKSVQKEGEQK